MSPKRRLLIVALFVLVVALAIGGELRHYYAGRYGYVEISIQLPDTKNLAVKLNNEMLSTDKLDDTYKLPAGEERLTVTKPGYKPFSTSFTVSEGQSLAINVSMQLVKPVSAAAATPQIQSTFASSLPAGFAIQQATYFYNNTWVVATIAINGGDPAVLVAEYNTASETWKPVLGPGSIFNNTDVQQLPAAVKAYMFASNYVYQDDYNDE